jgi:serine/threonine protein kinase
MAMPDKAPEPTGKLGRYVYYEEIGSGGFSNVFRAIDSVLEREVALKVLRPFLMSEPDFVTRFNREAKVAASQAVNLPGPTKGKHCLVKDCFTPPALWDVNFLFFSSVMGYSLVTNVR